MNSKSKVIIIILNWNGIVDTLALLRNLEQVVYPDFSVLVVDNGSTDDSVAQLEHYKKQTGLNFSILLLPENVGYSEGNNRGVGVALKKKPDYYLLLNNDTLVTPDFLDKLVETMENNDKLGAVGPTVYWADKNGKKQSKIWFAGGWMNFFAGGAHHRTNPKSEIRNPKLIPTEFLTGCCLLLRRSAQERIDQLFDPVYFAYGEDVDLSLRLRQAGFQLAYVPTASVWHKLATSSGGAKSYNFWYYNVRNNFLLLARYGSWYHWPVFIGYFIFYKPVLVSIAGAILRPRPDKWQRMRAIAAGTTDAIRGRWERKR